MMKQKNSLLPSKNKTKHILFITLGIVVIMVVYQVHFMIQAQQQAQSLEVSPPSQDISADPGKTITVKAKVRNATTKPLTLSAHIEDFTAMGDEGQVALTTQAGDYSVARWTKLSPEKFTLDGGAEQEVTAVITVPENSAGGKYGSFVFAVTTEKQKGNVASVSQQIASLFLLRINGPVNEKMSIATFQAPRFSEFGPITFSLKFLNNGNIHSAAYGLVNVTDMFGNKQADIVVKGTNVFPGAGRTISVNFNKVFLFGPYTATAVMYYGTNQKDTLTATTTFFVLPIRLIAGILIIIIILFLLRKRFSKAMKALAGK